MSLKAVEDSDGWRDDDDDAVTGRIIAWRASDMRVQGFLFMILSVIVASGRQLSDGEYVIQLEAASWRV